METDKINKLIYLPHINTARKVLYTLILLSFLLSMRLWIGWEGRAYRLNMFIGLIAFLIMLTKHIPFSLTKQNLITFIFVIIANFFCGYEATIYTPFYFLPYFVIICLNDQEKIQALNFITKWYGYLMIPSLIVYCLVSTIDLPYLGYQHASEADWAIANDYGICKNYIFYMQSQFGDYATRFNGPFLEPGHVGMISAFLIFVNQFNFKKKGMWPILIALLFTLSLAGYALLIIGFLIHIYYRGKIKAKYLFLCILLLIAIYLGGTYYNGGDNILYEKILSRLEYDKEKGFAGNNRVFGMIDIYYAELWTDIDKLLWGYPKETMDWLADNGSRGTGYIMSMCRYGLIGTILSVIFYFIYAIMNKYKKYAFCCFIFVLFMFWQRSNPFWSSWIICFIYGITNEKYKYNNK